MSLPNLFTHARSELAQDAVLAYLLEWAAPQHRETHPKLNALGEALLRALFNASAHAIGGATLAAADPLTDVKVRSQTNKIDVLVLVNQTYALVIEDKVNAHEHSGQIARYKALLSHIPSPSGAAWAVHAVYVKTGNESPSRRPTADLCGVMMRSELLAVLDRFPSVENQIVREFCEHLHRIQADTESYRTLPPSQWSSRAVEGFYGAIADWLIKLHSAGELRENPWPQWSYQSNPRGGERVSCWSWTDLALGSSQMWLQLNDAATLHLRVANAEQGGVKPKVQPSQLNEILQHLARAAEGEPWIGRIRVRKAGRFGGGDSAAVAELTFDASADGWLPLDAHKLLDWPEACRRLRLAMQFLDSLRLVEQVQP